MSTHCPKCGYGLWWDGTRCSNCNYVTSAGQSDSRSDADKVLEAAPHEKADTIHFACPECGTKVRAPVMYAGKRAKCKQCGTKIPVPLHASNAQKDPLPETLQPTEPTTDNSTPKGSATGLTSEITDFWRATWNAWRTDVISSVSSPLKWQCERTFEYFLNECGSVKNPLLQALLTNHPPRPGEFLISTSQHGNKISLALTSRRLWIRAKQKQDFIELELADITQIDFRAGWSKFAVIIRFKDKTYRTYKDVESILTNKAIRVGLKLCDGIPDLCAAKLCVMCKCRTGEAVQFRVGELESSSEQYVGSTQGLLGTTEKYTVKKSYINVRAVDAHICDLCAEASKASEKRSEIVYGLPAGFIILSFLFNLFVDVSSDSVQFNPDFSQFGPIVAALKVFTRATFLWPSGCAILLGVICRLYFLLPSSRKELQGLCEKVSMEERELLAISAMKNDIAADWPETRKTTGTLTFWTSDQFANNFPSS